MAKHSSRNQHFVRKKNFTEHFWEKTGQKQLISYVFVRIDCI